MNTFQLDTSRPNPTTVLLKMRGAADLLAFEKIEAAINELGNRVLLLVVDLEGVEFINTPVWALFCQYADAAMESGRRVVVAGMSDKVKAAYEMMGLIDFIPAYRDVAAALAEPVTP